MTDRPAHEWRQLAALFSQLRAEGFHFSPDTYLRAYQLAQRTENPALLKWRLAPLFAGSKKEQELFYQIFDRFFIDRQQSPEIHKEKPPPPEEYKDPETGRREAGPAKAISRLFVYFATLIPLLAVLWLIARRYKAQGELSVFLSVAGAIALILIIYDLFRIGAEWIGRYRRRAVLRAHFDPGPQQFRTLRLPDYQMVQFDRRFTALATRLRRRLPSDQPALDARATVRATVREGGFFVPRHIYRSLPPSYLLLIDNTTTANHRARLYEMLYRWLAYQQVPVHRFFYRHDLRHCWNEQHPAGLSLEQLAGRFAGSRLLVLGDGWKFLHPTQARLAPWAETLTQWLDRALLTPVSPSQWSQREALLQRAFVLAPASADGLSYMGRFFDRTEPRAEMPQPAWTHESPVVVQAETLAPALNRLLPEPGLQIWLRALSCFPQLHWKLTLYLGDTLSRFRNEQLLTFENLRRLTRFSWFYNGYLPADIRQALYKQLDEATRLLIHQAIYEWLKEQARDPDPEWRQEGRLTELVMALHKAAAGLASSQELSELRRQVRESGYLQLEFTDDFAEYELQPLPPELLRSLTTSDPLETAAVWSRRIVQRAAEFFQPSPIAAPSAEQAPVPVEDIPREDPAPSGSRPDMVFIPSGTFQMGDVMGDKESDDETVHEVKLSAFHLGRYAVTFDEFDAFCEATGRKKPGDEGWGRGKRPVINVSWYDAVEYCNWLSELWGLKPAYVIDKNRKDPNNKSDYDKQKWLVTFDPKADGYRLPTEAEWEYAAREGGKKVRFGNGKDIADPKEINFDGSKDYKKPYSVVGEYRQKTVPVGSLNSPNALGLHDMSGNVWEWCWDWYGPYPSTAQVDPKGADKGSYRVLRGGGWSYSPRSCRAAARSNWYPPFRYGYVGFRLARSLEVGPSGFSMSGAR